MAITYSQSAEAAETVAAACREKGVEAEAMPADSGNAKDVAGLVDKVVERFGRLDILVNNAGVLSSASLEETTDEEFDRAMNVNVRGVFVVSRSADRVMGEGGRIINIGSIFGESMPLANLGPLHHEQVRRSRFDPGLGAGPRPPGNHRELCPAWAD